MQISTLLLNLVIHIQMIINVLHLIPMKYMLALLINSPILYYMFVFPYFPPLKTTYSQILCNNKDNS